MYLKPEQIDYRLYMVTDRSLLGDRDLRTVVRAAIAGGVTVVQLREKDAPGQQFVEIAQRLLSVTRPANVPLIVNDRIDVALAAGADGVHIGQDDMPADRARHMIGPYMILGVTVRNRGQLHRAMQDGADYVGTGPFADTPTKKDTPAPKGVEGIRHICSASNIPVVAIGGINADNAADPMRAGAAGIAVVRAIMTADDPRRAAQQLRTIVDPLLEQRA